MDAGNVTAIYAAVVSTFLAAWEIYKFRHENSGRIQVRPIVIPKVPLLAYHTGDGKLDVLITNHSKSPRTIKLPSLVYKLPKGLSIFDHVDIDNDIFNKGDFPRTLQPGEEYHHTFPYSVLKTLHAKGINEIAVAVCDTYGKVYSSKNIPL